MIKACLKCLLFPICDPPNKGYVESVLMYWAGCVPERG